MTTETQESALNALEGMRQIVRREMITTGCYIDEDISSPQLARSGAICGGRKHCAIGSLWAGYGIKPFKRSGFVQLPGVHRDTRKRFTKTRPGLRLALNALNAAATEFADKNNISVYNAFDDNIENLFEGHYGDKLSKRDLLGIISKAKRSIKTGAIQYA